MSRDDDEEELEIDLAAALGVLEAPSQQTLTLYIPDRDREGHEIGTQRRWVIEAAELLAEIGGGVTIQPPVEGGWYDEAARRVIWERPVLVYTHVRPRPFVASLPRLRGFLHRLGRETMQGAVALEFGDEFFRIQVFER
jgi:hypothetical protein